MGRTKAANGTSYRFPHSKKQANRCKRLLPTAQRPGVFVAISALSVVLVISLDLSVASGELLSLESGEVTVPSAAMFRRDG